MKSIKILSITLFVTLLIFSGLYAFGHPPCQTETKAVDEAEDTLNEAKETVNSIYKEIGKAALAGDWAEGVRLYEELQRAKNAVEDAEEALKTARNARDVCLAHAYRTCGCAVHDTENPTSCSCYYRTWNGWCHCPT